MDIIALYQTHSIFPSSWSHTLCPSIHRSTHCVWFLTHSCRACFNPHNLYGFSCTLAKHSWMHAMCVVHHDRISLHVLSPSSYTALARTTPSENCKSVRKPHTNHFDTPVALSSASQYFQMLPGPPGAKQSGLKRCQSILRCSWRHQQLWRCIEDPPRFDL